MTLSVTNSLVFSQLLARLEAIGGEISVANLAGPGGFYIAVNHPDVNVDHRDNEDTVQIKCRKGLFPPTRAHVDVDDIMTVIEGWMKEAGGKCGASKAELPCEKCGHSSYEHDMTGCLVAPCECHERGPRYGTVGMTREKAYQKGYERRPEELRAELLAKKRQGWGVDKPRTPRAKRNTQRPEPGIRYDEYGNELPYVVIATFRQPDPSVSDTPWRTLGEALNEVKRWKSDPDARHIELTDHRPGGKEWYYDRDRSGFWKRTVHN